MQFACLISRRHHSVAVMDRLDEFLMTRFTQKQKNSNALPTPQHGNLFSIDSIAFHSRKLIPRHVTWLTQLKIGKFSLAFRELHVKKKSERTRKGKNFLASIEKTSSLTAGRNVQLHSSSSLSSSPNVKLEESSSTVCRRFEELQAKLFCSPRKKKNWNSTRRKELGSNNKIDLIGGREAETAGNAQIRKFIQS